MIIYSFSRRQALNLSSLREIESAVMAVRSVPRKAELSRRFRRVRSSTRT